MPLNRNASIYSELSYSFADVPPDLFYKIYPGTVICREKDSLFYKETSKENAVRIQRNGSRLHRIIEAPRIIESCQIRVLL